MRRRSSIARRNSRIARSRVPCLVTTILAAIAGLMSLCWMAGSAPSASIPADPSAMKVPGPSQGSAEQTTTTRTSTRDGVSQADTPDNKEMKNSAQQRGDGGGNSTSAAEAQPWQDHPTNNNNNNNGNRSPKVENEGGGRGTKDLAAADKAAEAAVAAADAAEAAAWVRGGGGGGLYKDSRTLTTTMEQQQEGGESTTTTHGARSSSRGDGGAKTGKGGGPEKPATEKMGWMRGRGVGAKKERAPPRVAVGAQDVDRHSTLEEEDSQEEEVEVGGVEEAEMAAAVAAGAALASRARGAAGWGDAAGARLASDPDQALAFSPTTGHGRVLLRGSQLQQKQRPF